MTGSIYIYIYIYIYVKKELLQSIRLWKKSSTNPFPSNCLINENDYHKLFTSKSYTQKKSWHKIIYKGWYAINPITKPNIYISLGSLSKLCSHLRLTRKQKTKKGKKPFKGNGNIFRMYFCCFCIFILHNVELACSGDHMKLWIQSVGRMLCKLAVAFSWCLVYFCCRSQRLTGVRQADRSRCWTSLCMAYFSVLMTVSSTNLIIFCTTHSALWKYVCFVKTTLLLRETSVMLSCILKIVIEFSFFNQDLSRIFFISILAPRLHLLINHLAYLYLFKLELLLLIEWIYSRKFFVKFKRLSYILFAQHIRVLLADFKIFDAIKFSCKRLQEVYFFQAGFVHHYYWVVSSILTESHHVRSFDPKPNNIF